MRFLVEISDDQETGTEAIVYTAKDVANKGAFFLSYLCLYDDESRRTRS